VQVDAVDTFWKDIDNALTITVTVTATDKLTDTETGTAVTFNVGADEQHLLTYPNKRGKLVKIRHEAATTTQNLEYRGAILTSWPRGRV
jgi:multidrug efflux pump subunit AcrA (membrane-fusion protein)